MKKSTLHMIGYIVVMVLMVLLVVYGKDVFRLIMGDMHTDSMLRQILR